MLCKCGLKVLLMYLHGEEGLNQLEMVEARGKLE